MKRLALAVLILAVTGCSTITNPINAIHAQGVAKLEADIQAVKSVGVASGSLTVTTE